MPRHLERAAAIGVAAAMLTSCETSPGRSGDAALVETPDLADLTDGSWVADGINDPDRELVPGSSITITFTDSAVSANAGCNTLHGSASIEDDELVVSGLASTMKACEQPLMQQDKWLDTLLTSRPVIEQHEDDLWLSADDIVVHLVASDD